MKISLCITTYNKPLQLEQVLAAVKQMTVLPFEVVICDDGSTQETRIMLERTALKFPVSLRHLWKPDLGWQVSEARNMGILAAAGDYIVFLDGDCVPHRKFLKDHLDLSREGCFVLGDRAHVKEAYIQNFRPTFLKVMLGVLFRRLRKRHLAVRNPFERPDQYCFDNVSAARLADLAVGCNMAFWKDDIFRINGFDESLEGWALEDIEMAARLLVSGLTARKVRKKAIAYHLDHGEAVYDDKTILDATRSVFEKKISWTSHGLKKVNAVSS